MVAKQLMQANMTDWDTRTPPRIKVHRTTKRPAIAEIQEVSHMGVAEAIDVDKFMETTIKETPKTTTDSGLSTWILLSGNSPTTKPPKKETPKTTPRPMSTVKFVEKITKYPQKPKTTTRKPGSTTTKKVTTPKVDSTESTVTTSKPTTKALTMTKIKASVLNSAQNNKTRTTTTKAPNSSKTTTPSTTTTGTTPKTTTTTEENSSTENELGPEAKIVDLELLESRETTKKPTRKPATNTNANKNQNQNKKKNKVRRKKPEEAPNNKTKTNATKVATKEKPIATQFYNYLSREVMPTVGVGLVGLVLTAGLASYFLFPFNTLRRNYVGALDRKDDHAYETYFSDGELEQDFIGKMIEGGYEYTSASNSVYQPSYNRYDPYKYDDRIVSERQKETGYTVDDRRYENKFVPDNFVPVTPAVVPEHGPRNFPETLKDSTTSQPESSTRKFVVGNIPEGYIPGSPIGVPEHGPRSLRIRRNAPKPIPIASIEEVVPKKGKKHFVLRKKARKSIPLASVDEISYLRPPTGVKSFQTSSRSVENEVTSSKVVETSKNVYKSGKTKREIPNSGRGTQVVPKALDNAVIRYKDDFGVPKHGPRSLRMRRNVPETTTVVPKDQENEVGSPKDKFHKYKLTKYAELKKNATLTTTEVPAMEKNETTTTTIVYHEEQPANIFSFLRNIFEMKVRIGLNFLLNTTENFSKYLRGVQERVEKVIVENRERYKTKNIF